MLLVAPLALRYFVAANAWLAATILLIVGQSGTEHDGRSYSSFLGVGTTPSLVYFTIVAALAVLTAWYFVLACRRPAPGANVNINRYSSRR